MSSRTSASAVILVIVLSFTLAQENAEYEVTTVGFSNETYADSNGEEGPTYLEEASETTTEMPPEPGTLPGARGHRMAHRKWKETKQQPSMLPGPAVPGCCLVSFNFLCAIMWPHTVEMINTLVSGMWSPCVGYISSL